MTSTHAGSRLVRAESCPTHPLEQQHWNVAGTLSVPGRANLIGEHMDYNGGHSVPFAIGLGLRFTLSFRKRTDEESHLCVGPVADGSARWFLLDRAERPFPTETSKRDHGGAPDLHGSFAPEHRRAGIPYFAGAWHLAGSPNPEDATPPPAPGLPPGFDLCVQIAGDLPPGAGLSSSAALSLGLLIVFRHARTLLNRLNGASAEHSKSVLNSPPVDLQSQAARLHLARLAQLIEHRYAGTPCGLMDQLAIVMTPSEGTLGEPISEGKETHPGGTLSQAVAHGVGPQSNSFFKPAGTPARQTYVRIAFPAPAETHTSNSDTPEPPALFPFAAAPLFDRYDTYILHSGKEHDLSDGHYALRRDECRAALLSLNSFWNTHEATLGDFFRNALEGSSEGVFQNLSGLPELISRTFWASENLKARAKFVAEEIQRVTLACQALASGNAHHLSELLAQAQDGLSQDYLVSCPEIDCAVNQLRTAAMHLGTVSAGRARVPALIGPRMMGGGFGGSLVFLVHQDCGATAFDHHMNNALERYQQQTSCTPRLLKTHKSAGISWQAS